MSNESKACVQVRQSAVSGRHNTMRWVLALSLCVSPLPLMAQQARPDSSTSQAPAAPRKTEPQNPSPNGTRSEDKPRATPTRPEEPHETALRSLRAFGNTISEAASRAAEQATEAVNTRRAQAAPATDPARRTPSPALKPALKPLPTPAVTNASGKGAATKSPLRMPRPTVAPLAEAQPVLPESPIPYTALQTITPGSDALSAPQLSADAAPIAGTVTTGFQSAMSAISAVTAENARSVGSLQVTYGPVPAWTVPPPPPNTRTPPTGAPIHIIHSDTQTRIEANQVMTFTRFRARVLNRQGMMLGDLNLTWEPSANTVRVHNVTIFRNGQAIEMLPGLVFSDGQRMEGSGDLPGDFLVRSKAYVPGLEVGDELELSMTITHREPNVRHTSNGILTGRESPLPHDSRLRLTWPITLPLDWRVSRDLSVTAPVKSGNDYDLTMTVPSTPKPKLDTAAPRYNITNQLSYSAYKDWAALSSDFYPHFAAALELEKTSPIRAEAQRIRAMSDDPLIRASEALKLVQDKIRYVNIALNGGNIIPPKADSVFARRYGDCKGKSVLLAALLKELGITAEVILVSTESGDSLATSLPLIAAFNHVIVRAEINGQNYWLDGTRAGEQHLLTLDANDFRHGLPLRPAGAKLVAIAPQGSSLPDFSYDMVVDAASGTRNAKALHTLDVRNNYARLMTYVLATAEDDKKKELVRQLFSMAGPWITNRTLSWAYNEPNNRLTLTLSGQGEMPSQLVAKGTYRVVVDGMTVAAPPVLNHSGPADKSIPMIQDFPEMSRATSTIRLPVAPTSGGWLVGYKDINATVDQTLYTRDVTFDVKNRTLKTTISSRNLTPEITQEDIQSSLKARGEFDKTDAALLSSDQISIEGVLTEALKRGAEAGIPLPSLMYMVYLDAENAEALSLKKLIQTRLNKEFPNEIQTSLVNMKALLEQENYSGALEIAKKLLNSDKNEQLYLLNASLQAQLERHTEARATLSEGLALFPKSSNLLALMGQNNRHFGRYDEALANYDKAIAAEPDNLVLSLPRADTLMSLGRLTEAAQDMNRAIRTNPDLSWALGGRADYFLASGLPDLASEDLREALRLASDSTYLQKRMIMALILKGERAEAQTLAARFAQTVPDKGTLVNHCATLILLNPTPDSAKPVCQQAAQANSRNALPLAELGLLALREGKADEAAQLFERILGQRPQDVEALYGRSLIKDQRGDTAGAEQDRQQAKRSDPALFRFLHQVWPKL